jgi:hypothetical protein
VPGLLQLLESGGVAATLVAQGCLEILHLKWPISNPIIFCP